MYKKQKCKKYNGYSYCHAISNVIKSVISSRVCISKIHLVIITYISFMLVPCFGTCPTITCDSNEEKLYEQNSTMVSPEIISKKDIISAGIPEDCIPANIFFNSDATNYNQKWNIDILQSSSLYSDEQDFDSFCFFIVPTKEREEEMPLIDIWMYNINKKFGKMIYHQTDNNGNFVNIIGINWGYEISSHDSTAINSVSREKYNVVKKTARPIVILSTADDITTVHTSPSILIIDAENDKIKFLKNQQFVSLIKTDDRSLMDAEIGLGKTYIISTSTIYKEKSEKFRELTDEVSEKIEKDGNERVDIVIHNYLTPMVNIYTLNGELAGHIMLPIDQIDTIR